MVEVKLARSANPMGEILEPSWQPLIKPGTLWAKAAAQTKSALASGALHPISTHSNFIEQGGICFLVRVLANLARKDEAKQQEQNSNLSGKQQSDGKQSDKPFNPFLPYDRNLFVADLLPTHVCLLNKYNVVDHHLLIITRDFEEQETLLTLNDFIALWLCLAEIEGLGFYNSGKMAGASQRHKHLQLVPLPLVPTGEKIPIETIFTTVDWNGAIGTSAALPFQHGFIRWNWSEAVLPQQAAQQSLEAYLKLLRSFNLYSDQNPDQTGEPQLKGAYNLLVTREWMMIVPRTQEQFETIPVNSLGFAGTLFVRNQQQFEQLKAISPLTLLKHVAVAVE